MLEKAKCLKFDEIVLKVIPLSKNGIQANDKMIKEILNEIAVEDKTTRQWRLKDEDMHLFKGQEGF